MNLSQYHFLRLISITVFLAFAFATPISAQEKSRKKVGIALSGGGAKGFAHIGALKVLEEAGIPIDYIAGTSMGAIIGGLYALGYSASDLDSIAKTQDWNYLLTDNVYRENLSPYLKENANQYIVSLPYELQLKQKSGKVSSFRVVKAKT
jgi:NTE family protein